MGQSNGTGERLTGSTETMIPLAVRSYYSLMWGTRSPRKICAVARELGYRRLALTDTDNLYGLWPFLSACRQEGITPIVGAELTDPAPVAGPCAWWKMRPATATCAA